MPAWGTELPVATNTALAESVPKVAVSSKGKAVAVFERGAEVWSNSYDPATNIWGTPVQIDGRAGATTPQIAVDKNDTYTAVWVQDPSGPNKGVWWSTSSDGGAHWTPLAAITTTAAMSPALSVNADGVAVVAWTEATADYWQIAASFRAAPGAAWLTPVTFPANDSESNDRDAAVAVSGKGEAFVVWHQDDKGNADQDSIWEMHHTAAGWSAARLFETYNDGPCFAPAVRANTAGTVVATWVEVGASAASSETLRARRYVFGGGDFAAPVGLETGVFIDDYQAPALALDESGTATMSWAFEIQSKWQVYAARTSFVGTGTAGMVVADLFVIETDDAATEDDPNDASVRATLPALGVDPTGNVTLVWRKRVTKTRFDAWSRRLLKGADAWTTPKRLESRDIGSVEWPAIGVGSDGTAVAVWDYTVEADVYAAVFR